MSHSLRRVALLTSLLSLLAGAALAGPIDGKRLVFREYGTAGKAALTFVAKDPGIVVSAPGVYGDPSQTGLHIDVITRTETVKLFIPGGPGWRVRHGERELYMYKGSSVGNDDFVAFVIRDGGLKLRMRGLRLGETPPFEAVAIRVRLATDWSCAAFIGGSVRRNDDGIFAGSAAPADALADCLETSIDAALTPCGLSAPQCGGTCPDAGECSFDIAVGCVCVSPHQPCGGTAPVCNGECDSGEECFTVNPNRPSFESCVCAPSGQIPCGATGGTYCPVGSSCQNLPGRPGLYEGFSTCIDDSAVCGESGFGSCPSDSQCVPSPPGLTWSCLPFFCGPYPSCGGTCPSGLQCAPLSIESTGFCICVEP